MTDLVDVWLLGFAVAIALNVAWVMTGLVEAAEPDLPAAVAWRHVA